MRATDLQNRPAQISESVKTGSRGQPALCPVCPPKADVAAITEKVC
jgi:hypothetical protein